MVLNSHRTLARLLHMRKALGGKCANLAGRVYDSCCCLRLEHVWRNDDNRSCLSQLDGLLAETGLDGAVRTIAITTRRVSGHPWCITTSCRPISRTPIPDSIPRCKARQAHLGMFYVRACLSCLPRPPAHKHFYAAAQFHAAPMDVQMESNISTSSLARL